MSESLNLVYEAIDRQNAEETASSRRKFIGGAAAAIGGMGLLNLSSLAEDAMAANNPQTILNIAATAEVLATIVNTIGYEQVTLDPVTKANVAAAAREELIHYNVLTSVGGKALTKKIWVPDAVFASARNFLKTLVRGDQIFVNAYMIGTTAFARARQPKFARYTAEFMGVEAVHRALARQSLGLLGNDRVFMRYQFTHIETAVSELMKAGIGFGQEGSKPGRFYSFNEVKQRTPNPVLNTYKPR